MVNIRRKKKTLVSIVLLLVITVGTILINIYIINYGKRRVIENTNIFLESPIDRAYYKSMAGSSLWKSLRTVNPRHNKVSSFINNIEIILFDYNWALNQSISGRYRLWLIDRATRVIFLDDPKNLFNNITEDIKVKISVYNEYWLGKKIIHRLSNGVIRLGRIILPHGVEIIVVAIINSDNVVIGYNSNGKVYRMNTLKYLVYVRPYNLTTYKYFLEIHRTYGRPPPITDIYKEKVKPGQWKWVMYKTFIISNKPVLILGNGTKIPLEYIAIIEEYPYTGCDTEILWSLFYRSLAFALALNIALPPNTSEKEFYGYALKIASQLMVYKPYYYKELTSVYCLPELAKIGGFCYEHSLTGMELYNLVFRLPYFILYMRSRITGLGHSVGVVVIPSAYIEDPMNNALSNRNNGSFFGAEAIQTGIDFDGDNKPDYILEVVNTGGTSIYEKMTYYQGQLLFLLDKAVVWGMDHYYPFKYIILTPYGEQADISVLSGLKLINDLLRDHPWFKLPYYSRSKIILTKIHELENTFLLKRAGVPTVGTPAGYNVTTDNTLSLIDYYHYVVTSRVIYPPIPSQPSPIEDTSWIPVILSIKMNLVEIINELKTETTRRTFIT